MSRIIISDPHGCYKTLVNLISKLPVGIPITFAGDLIDRGPDSRKIIEFVKENKYDCVVGNHEVMMIDEINFVQDKDGKETAHVSYMNGIWLVNGGDKTLDSYELSNGHYDIEVLKEHVNWLKSLPYYIHYEDEKDNQGQTLLVSHSTAARVWGKLPHDSENFKSHLIWERNGMPPKIEGIFNCYGHTPQVKGYTIKDHFGCIDGGCYYKGYQKLIALQFPEMIVYEQENVEDKV